MRMLVTGGAGFIGSNFVRHILRERPDVEIVNLDALTYAGHRANLGEWLTHERHSFVHGDICDAALVVDLMSGIDVVCNLAAESHVDRSIVSDAPFVRTNVTGTATLLGAALQAGVQRFVQVSTDEVYGELPWRDPEQPAHGPVDRFTEDTPLAPRSPYSATKAAGDLLALAYHETHGLDVVITRCSNNYGPYQYPEKLIPVLIEAATEGRPLPLYGDGLNVRDWIWVEDHCAGLLAAAERGRAGGIYNFGGDEERTNLWVARAILSALDRPESLIELVPDRPGHDRRYAVAFDRAREELGWEPTVGFADGLRRTVSWYSENRAWCDTVRSPR